jgi:hypothetical protein
MRHRLLGLAIALSIAGPLASAGAQGMAEPRDAAALGALCQSEEMAFCYGYITGAGQFYAALLHSERIAVEPFVCPGREVSQAEAVGVFLGWLAADPSRGSQPAIDGLFRAWAAEFPCA